MKNWLSRGDILPDESTIKKLYFQGMQWQLYSTSCDGFALAVSQELINRWNADGIEISRLFVESSCCYLFVDNGGTIISSLEYGPYLNNYDDCMVFASVYRKSLEKYGNIVFCSGIYIEKYSAILPTYPDTYDDNKTVLGRYLTAGVTVSTDEFDRLCRLMSWLHPTLISEVINQAGFSVADGNAIVRANTIENTRVDEIGLTSPRYNIEHKTGDRFSLPGRPELEEFFNEHVVDIVLNAEKYKRVGIGFPSPIVLYGEPGCGKTYAVNKLIEFLGWPSYHLDSGSIGSPYIHDTSKKISELFDAAMNNSPSVIVIDEMEAFLTDRGIAQSSGQHHVEEVAEFLRKIPEANSKNVLVVAMTNMIDSIDKAILRRGRFDHILEIKMPSKEEIIALLENEVKKLPLYDDVNIDEIAERLAGHPMSDVVYVLKEAGRRAVKQNDEAISQQMFISVCDEVISNENNKKPVKHTIGFGS